MNMFISNWVLAAVILYALCVCYWVYLYWGVINGIGDNKVRRMCKCFVSLSAGFMVFWASWNAGTAVAYWLHG